jgi:hypothetical protein
MIKRDVEWHDRNLEFSWPGLPPRALAGAVHDREGQPAAVRANWIKMIEAAMEEFNL